MVTLRPGATNAFARPEGPLAIAGGDPAENIAILRFNSSFDLWK